MLDDYYGQTMIAWVIDMNKNNLFDLINAVAYETLLELNQIYFFN